MNIDCISYNLTMLWNVIVLAKLLETSAGLKTKKTTCIQNGLNTMIYIQTRINDFFLATSLCINKLKLLRKWKYNVHRPSYIIQMLPSIVSQNADTIYSKIRSQPSHQKHFQDRNWRSNKEIQETHLVIYLQRQSS